MSIDAMQQALKALESINEMSKPPMNIPLAAEIDGAMDALRTAIREAALDGLAETSQEIEPWDTSDMAHRPGGLSVEQEPVAWVRDLTSPQPHCVTSMKYLSIADTDAGVKYIPVYAAPPKREQEPVAWMVRDSIDGSWYPCAFENPAGAIKGESKPLYAAPPKRPVKSYTGGEPQYATDAPKREWQGLTDEEVAAYSDMFNGIRLMKAIEALLKRRNNG
jgi:hypothetical protein